MRLSSPGLIIARAPLRVSLVGGGTDLLNYSSQFGGRAISAAINRYVWVVVYPNQFSGLIRVAFDAHQEVSDVDELRHVFGRAILRRCPFPSGVQVASFSDVPPGTGLGGSAAFTVATLRALYSEEDLPQSGLGQEASDIEVVDLKRPVGRNDHYISALGGIREITTERDGTVKTVAFQVNETVQRYISQRLLLFYTGVQRDAGAVLADQDQQIFLRSEAVLASLHRIRALTDELAHLLRAGLVEEIGPLLHEHWMNKIRLSDKVTTSRINKLYTDALHAGADGGKLLGAGSGGFLLLSCPESRQEELRAVMARSAAAELSFSLELQGATSWEISPSRARRWRSQPNTW